MRRAAVVAVAMVAGGCGGGAQRPSPTATVAPTPSAQPPAARIAIAPSDRQACTVLFARLQRVTVALSSSSELVAQSVDKNDLSSRIATEQQQLERSARLMAAGIVPAPLVAPNRRLVAALRAFARDFARAKAPAKRGDFPAAVDAMTDRAVVNRIVAAATTIEDACKP